MQQVLETTSATRALQFSAAELQLSQTRGKGPKPVGNGCFAGLRDHNSIQPTTSPLRPKSRHRLNLRHTGADFSSLAVARGRAPTPNLTPGANTELGTGSPNRTSSVFEVLPASELSASVANDMLSGGATAERRDDGAAGRKAAHERRKNVWNHERMKLRKSSNFHIFSYYLISNHLQEHETQIQVIFDALFGDGSPLQLSLREERFGW